MQVPEEYNFSLSLVCYNEIKQKDKNAKETGQKSTKKRWELCPSRLRQDPPGPGMGLKGLE